jgi:hypothetical protein
MKNKLSLSWTSRLAVSVFLLFTGLAAPLHAEDRDGFRLTVNKNTVSRRDGPSTYTKEIDRDLLLKAVLLNTSMKDRKDLRVEWVILIKRWLGESGALERNSGKMDVALLKRSEATDVKTGTFHIGGHMHGSSKMHVDELEGWKFTVFVDGKPTEFRSSTSFDALNQRAVDVGTH